MWYTVTQLASVPRKKKDEFDEFIAKQLFLLFHDEFEQWL